MLDDGPREIEGVGRHQDWKSISVCVGQAREVMNKELQEDAL